MWSVGVVLLSIMTRRPVFFVSGDDFDAVEEVACFTGTRPLEELARQLDRQLVFSTERPTLTWKTLVQKCVKPRLVSFAQSFF